MSASLTPTQREALGIIRNFSTGKGNRGFPERLVNVRINARTIDALIGKGLVDGYSSAVGRAKTVVYFYRPTTRGFERLAA